jgi:hypothetical protein
MAHATGRKPAPDVGCCAKFGAFLIGTAGVAGLATAAFGGPIVGGAAGGIATKVVETVGPKPGEPSMFAAAGAAYAGKEGAGTLLHYYNQECTHFTQNIGCAALQIGTVACVGLTVLSIFALYKIATGQWGGGTKAN